MATAARTSISEALKTFQQLQQQQEQLSRLDSPTVSGTLLALCLPLCANGKPTSQRSPAVAFAITGGSPHCRDVQSSAG